MGAAHSAGRVQKAHSGRLEIDQNFDHFLTSIFGRFWVVLGRQVGVILGTFGGQDGTRSIQNTSWKPINVQNVISHQTHARVYRSAILEPKMPPKMPQDRPKTAPRGSWRAFFSLLKIVLNFDAFWGRFWSILAPKMEPKKCSPKIFGGLFCGSKMLFVFVLFWIASKTAQEGPMSP